MTQPDGPKAVVHYTPYAPLDMPKEVARYSWIGRRPQIRFGAPGFKLAHPTRMTIVQLPGGNLWTHSPTAPSDSWFAASNSLVRLGLIAPNNFHYSWVLSGRCVSRWRVCGGTGSSGPSQADLVSAAAAGRRARPGLGVHARQFLVRGNVLNEAVEVGLLLRRSSFSCSRSRYPRSPAR